MVVAIAQNICPGRNPLWNESRSCGKIKELFGCEGNDANSKREAADSSQLRRLRRVARTERRINDQRPGDQGKLLKKVAVVVIRQRLVKDERHPEQCKRKIENAECDGAGSRSPGPLNGYASKDFDGGYDVHENRAVRNVPKRLDLLPDVKVMPDQGDHAEADGRQSIHVTSQIEFHRSQDPPG